MPLDANVLAAEVALAIKGAIGPVIERMVAAEARLAILGDLRDRVVVMETKMDRPAVVTELVASPAPPATDSLVLERIAAAETRLSSIGDLRDRVVVMETKMEQPVVVPEPAVVQPAPDTALHERIAAAEARIAALVADVTVKPTAPVPPVDLGDVRERLSVVETRTEGLSARVADVDTATKALAVVSERVAVLETRAPVPGPAGTDGKDGLAGMVGKNGVDGLGFDDLLVVQNDDRSFTIKAARGERVKDIGTAIFPVQIQRGVYLDGKSYENGDLVTWGGSQWFCNEATNTKPGEGSKAWTLVVKRGRDGKDGRDGHDAALPVVSVKR